MTESPRIQFRATAFLERALAERTDLPAEATSNDTSRLFSATGERDLKRYYDMLMRSLPTFSEGEAFLLCDIMNGSIIETHSIPLLWIEVSDALLEGYAEKWQVDGNALVARLRSLTPFECMAVGDAIERFWSGSYARPLAESRLWLHQTGLVVEGHHTPG